MATDRDGAEGSGGHRLDWVLHGHGLPMPVAVPGAQQRQDDRSHPLATASRASIVTTPADILGITAVALLALAVFRFGIPFVVLKIENALRRFFNLPGDA